MVQKPTPASEQLAAWLDEPETGHEAVVRMAGELLPWLVRIAEGGDYTPAEAEAVHSAYAEARGATVQRRRLALEVVEEWMRDRGAGDLPALATRLGHIDAKFYGLERCLTPDDRAELRGTVKRRGGPWEAKRVLAQLAHRTGALGVRRIAGKAIDPSLVKQTVKDIDRATATRAEREARSEDRRNAAKGLKRKAK